MAMSFAAISWAECLAVLLEERGGELRLQDFAQAYKARFGSAFRLATYGAESLESLCTGVEGIELVGTGADRLVRLARGRLPARRPAGGAVVIGDDDVTTATTTINSSSVVGVRQKGMAELKLRLHEVLKRYPGKTFSELKKLWPQEFRENLDLTKYNISGFNEFLIQLDSVCQIENGVLYPKFDPRMVETLIQVQRNSLISSKTYFDHGKIVAMVCNELGVKNFETLGMGRPWKVASISEMMKLEQNIDIYIDAYLATHPIGTLFDLEKYILAKERENSPRLQSYSDLRIAPLLRHPKVEIEFQPPRGLSVIPKVDGKDIMEALRRLIFDPARDRREKKIQPREIIETLAKVKGVNDPLLLCARATRHVGHYIRLINDMRKRADAMRKEAEKEAEMEAEREAEFAKQKAMASQKESLKQGLGSLSMLEHVLEPLQDRVLKEAPNVAEGWLLSDLAKFVPPDGEAGGLRDRVDVLLWHAAKHLPEGMTPTSLLSQDQVEVFSAALLDPPGDFLDVVFECLVEGTKQDKESLLDSHFSVIDFLNTDCFGQTLLQVLARYASSAHRPEGSQDNVAEGMVSEMAPTSSRPPFEEVRSAVAKQLGALISGSGVNALAMAERGVAAALGAAEFNQLGHGSLLEFIGASSSLASLAQRAAGSGNGVGFAGAAILSLEELAGQVLAILPADAPLGRKEAAVAKAFCLQCGVRGFDDLRLGCNLADLVSAAAEKQEQQPKVSVIGAAALLASCSPCNDIMGLGGGSVSCDTAAVGLLGEVDREAAARCLSAAPLLVDLLEWSHWTAVFQPSLGPLPEFLRSSRTTTALKLPRALATADGRLLKLPDGGGPADGFSAAIKRGCPEEAAGELLAVVIDCGSLELSPLTRLITAATAGLSARLASPPGDAASFWIRMIGLLPRELRAPMARAVLLPAFTEAAGKHHSHILLREAAEGDEASQSLLAALGLELGEAAWYNQWASQWQQSGEEGGSLTSGSHQKKHNSRAAGYGPEAVPMDLPSWLAPLPQAVTVIKGPSGEEAKDPTAAGMSDLQMKGGGLEGTTQHPDPYMGSEVDAGAGGGNLEEAKAVVEDIRKKLGILPRHKGMDEDVQRCLDEYPKLMGNACDKLSTELYSTDSHFVLELIQNADDNTYGSHVSPAVCFIVGAANSITVLNNEVGFTDRNIQALCSVGESTKQKKAGYIGQKGIGFKSVFRITDKPSVHSGGYHIAFDMNAVHGKLNYILPTWVGPEYLPGTAAASAFPELTQELNRPHWRTAIHLPLKVTSSNGENSVKFQFEDIDPSMLLFLRKLRHVTLWDAEAGTRREMRREDCPNSIVQVHCSGDPAPHSFLVVRRAVAPGVKRLGVSVEETEVCAAVMLSEGTHSSQQQPVFAFLPVASYGLRFILQADFVLPSSRESINVNDEWNQRLREEVPRLFADIMEACKQLARPGEEAAAAELWLRCMPLEGEVRDFFRPSVEAVHRTVAGMPCVLVEGGRWVQPCEALLATNVAMRELMQEQGILQEQGLSVVHPDLHPFAPALKAIGVRELGWEHLLSLLENAVAYSPDRLADLTWLATVLSCLQQCMAEARLPPQAVDALRRVRMLPVEGGAFVAAAEVQVYFPIKATTPGGRSSENVAAAAEAAGLRLSGVVELLRPELMDEMARVGLGGSDRASSQAILRQLGVQALTLHELVDRHLLSCLLGSGEQEGEEDKDRLLAMLGVVRHHSACLPSEADRAVLRSRLAGLKVLTANNGVERLRSRGAGDGGDVTPHVYLSSDFGCELLPPSLIEALGWVALDPGYLSRGGKRGEWRSFFHSLGARELPAPTAFRRMVTWEEKATDSIMAAEDWGHGPYTIKDWRFPEIEDLLGGSLSVRDRQALANCLDSSWDSHFSNFCTVSLLRRPDPFHDISLGEAMAEAEEDLALSHELSTSVPSTFLLRLKGSAWLPARDGSLYGPEQLFNVHRQDMAQIFRKIQDHLPVLDHTVIELRSHRFKQAIGLERHLSPSMLLDALRRCAADPVFKQSTEVLLPVYQQLATIMQMDNSVVTQVKQAMLNEALFYLPGLDAGQPSWYSMGSVRLRDSSGVIEQVGFEKTGLRVAGKRGRGAQDPGHTRYYEYNCMDSFFTCLTFVAPAASPRFPTPDEYLRVLEVIARDSSTVTSEQLNLVFKVFTMWADGIATWQGGQGKGLRPEEVAGWIPKIANLPIFPTTNKKWCSLAEGIYVCDDDELAKPFMAKAEQQAPAVQPKQKAEEESDNARARAAREAALARAAAASKAINFLYVPPPDSRSQRGGRMHHHLDNSIEPFLTALGIPRLSASVVVRIVTHQTFYGRPITNLVADIFPYIQRWIFHKRGRQEYMELEEHLNGSNRQRKLGEFSCEVMEKVEAEYNLKDRAVASVFVEQPVILDPDYMRLVVSRSHEKQYSVIFTELSRLFSYGRVDTDLVNFMVRVAFEASDAAGVDTVKIQAELSEMDSDVVPWEIKKTQILVTEQPEGASAEAAACQPEKDGADKKAKRKAKGNEAEEPLQVWPPPRPRSEMKLLQQQICSGPVGILPELPVPRGSSSANQAGSLPMVEPSSAFCQQQQSTVGGSPVALPSHVAPPRHSPEALPQTKSHNPQATQASGGSETPNPDTPCPATTDGPQQGNHAGSATPRNLHPDEPRDAGTPDRSDIRSMGFHTGGAGGFISEACKLALRDSLGALQLVPLELSALEMLGGNSETVLPSSLLDEDKQQVGRLGEQLIYQYLLKKYARTDAKVVWVNKEAETGKPYDLVITKSVEKSNTVVEYVEVKTSFSMDKLPFEMSIQELMFAEKHGPAYAIYRLIGVAAGAQPKLLEIWDPALGILAGQLNLVVVPLQ